ncbi:host specificity protein J [Cupriavidus plantarum]|uniref:host specificity protein J n=1 Tax=Cupriavidus plantarum TaxID=942865 RepID=UPI000EB3C645|nr:host specificity protein J [Cupriavidus plantarum]RLK45938.1 putative phage tail protein [Cupriavidus plantarum]
MRQIIGYGGGKGGGGGSAPTESPDSLHSISYAKVLDLVSEGEIGGLVNGLQSVFLNDTPLMNADGSMNFQNVSMAYRLGTQDQDYIPGFPSVDNETGVNVELTSEVPWSHAFTNLALSAIRIRMAVPSLSKADTSTGDISGYVIDYAIDVATDGGSYQTVLQGSFNGKTTSEYQRSHRIDLPPATQGWSVRIRRITPNANSSAVADTTRILSYTEVIDAKLRYPNSAIMALQIDARQFNDVPRRAYELYGRAPRVPSNYDPQTRNYSGVWDGTFKVAWTDNPAWIFYDLLLNARYGLGDRINASMVDKWYLYQIGQYCDELVADGRGGMEPRFTCNCYLQSRAQAYKVLQDLVSVFRGMAYWSGGAVMAMADMPSDPVYTFTAANVVDGKFAYAGVGLKARKTVALVSWNDPSDMYRAKVEYVPDDEGIARYGVREVELTAFGCTSQGQAHRVGLWTLLTSRLETETVTFKVGLDAGMVAPGNVVHVADPRRAGRRIGGRVRSASGLTVTLDKIDQAKAGDTLIVALPSGGTQSRTIMEIDGDQVRVNADWTEDVQPESVWATESAELKTQLFRIVGISEGDGIERAITALRHEPGKYGFIDSGTRLDPRPITVLPPSVQPPPAAVAIGSYSIIDQGIASTTMTINWPPAEKAIAYAVEWRRDNGEWVTAGRTGSLSIEVPNIYAGTYLARVRAYNALDVPSIPAYSVETNLAGKTSPPPVVTSLVATGLVMAIRLDWGFPPGPSDVERTEIWYSETSSREDAIKLADFAYPQTTHTMMGLAAAKRFWFWARLVDKSGNIGAWYPQGIGVAGQSSADAGPILGVLAGQIGRTQLAQDLLSDIESFAPPFAGSDTDMAGSEQIFAGVQSIQSAQQEGDMALALQQTTLQAQIGSNTALVQQTASAQVALDGKISAAYTIKVGVSSGGKYYGAGMAIGIDNENGPIQSQILFQADRFALLNVANDVVTTPFVVQGGQVFIAQALIGTGWITNLMIGDIIQSNVVNPVTGQPQWKLDKNGSLFLGGSGLAGNRMDGNALRTFNENGQKMVQLGNLSVA